MVFFKKPAKNEPNQNEPNQDIGLSNEDLEKLARHWREILSDPWLQVMLYQGSLELTPFVKKLIQMFPEIFTEDT